MTNNQIIYNAAISAGIYTQEEADAILMSGRFLPLHTFREWKERGYIVKKGEHAVLSVPLWKFTDRPSKARHEAAAKAGEELTDNPHYYKKLCYLFHACQVERADSESKPQTVTMFLEASGQFALA